MTRWRHLTWVFALLAALSTGAIRAEEPPPEENGEADTESVEKDEAKKDEDKDKKKKEEEDRYFAITGGVVHTVTQGDLYGATILTKNGKITDIGPNLILPEKVETLDVSGFHVYPGLIAASSSTVVGAEPPDDTSNVYALHMAIGLAGGITTAVSGNSAAKLTFGSTDDIVVARDLFTRLSYSRDDPSGRRELRQDLDRVVQYMRDLENYKEKKKTDPDAEAPDKDWLKGKYKKYHKLLKRETTANMTANTAQEILDACELANRYGIRIVVNGAAEGWIVASEMSRAGLSAVITPRNIPEPDPDFNRKTGGSIENAAILHKHGVRFAVVPPRPAITLWGLAGQDLLHLNMEAAFAVRGGLSNEAGLRAITLDAARVLGIDHRVGSIEVGKDADFIITDGDMLHYMTLVRWAVVNGRVAYDKQEETLFSHIRPGGDRDAPPPDDYWPRRLGDPQNAVEASP